jgi:hypothetical protein
MEEFYAIFRDMQRKALVPDEDMISFQRFTYNPSRAMEYAHFCLQYLNKWGSEFVKDSGGILCSYGQYDEYVSRYLEYEIARSNTG